MVLQVIIPTGIAIVVAIIVGISAEDFWGGLATFAFMEILLCLFALLISMLIATNACINYDFSNEPIISVKEEIVVDKENYAVRTNNEEYMFSVKIDSNNEIIDAVSKSKCEIIVNDKIKTPTITYEKHKVSYDTTWIFNDLEVERYIITVPNSSYVENYTIEDWRKK